MSIDIREISLKGKMKGKFQIFLSKNDLDSIYLGDFGRWEGGGICAVCGHHLVWSYRNENGRDIGICCAANIIALKRCNGNFEKLNFERELELARKTIFKRQKEFEKKQKVIQLEIKYSEEVRFCKEVIRLTFEDEFFKKHKVVLERDDKIFFPAGIHEKKYQACQKIHQCDDWLSWLNDGTVNEYYLEKLHEIMKQTPQEVIDEAKEKLKTAEIEIEIERKNNEENEKYYTKIVKLKKIHLNDFEKKFLLNLQKYYWSYEKFSDKQKAAIDKIFKKHKKQLEE